MKNYTITIDTGTTNTRVYLFNEKYEAVAIRKIRDRCPHHRYRR